MYNIDKKGFIIRVIRKSVNAVYYLIAHPTKIVHFIIDLPLHLNIIIL